MAVKTYDPKRLMITFAGAAIEGFADGTFLTVERRNPSFNLMVGADGEGARARSNDNSGTITLSLIQTSKSNTLLSAFSALDEASGNGVAPFFVKDLNSDTLLVAATAWVSKPANAEFGKEISNREWTLETDNITLFNGGQDVDETS
jgi:hypothetical protein